MNLLKDIESIGTEKDWERIKGLHLPGKDSSLQMVEDHLLNSMPEISRYFMEDIYFPKSIAMTRGKINQTFTRFKRAMSARKKWAQFHVHEALPTFYSILCVAPNAVDVARMEEVRKFKLGCSYMPPDVIDEAFRTLKNPYERVEYYRFLMLFQEAFIDLFNESEKAEILQTHADILSQEKRQIACGIVMQRHPNWRFLFDVGINLFAIARIKKSHDVNAVMRLRNKYSKDPSDRGQLLASICNNFSKPEVLTEYKVFLSIYPEVFIKGDLRKPIMALQNNYINKAFDSIDRTLILGNQPIKPRMEKWLKIHDSHADWNQFLPPNTATFYSVLGLDITASDHEINGAESKMGDEDDRFRSLLLDKFKNLPKSADVNQAYSVLKDPEKRGFYDWMLVHHLEMQRMESYINKWDEIARKVRKNEQVTSFNKLYDDLRRDPLFKQLVEKLAMHPGFNKFYKDLLAGKPLNPKDPFYKDLIELIASKGFR
nr:hypothetical protein [Candidatus Sigynarchaeota archaeon]